MTTLGAATATTAVMVNDVDAHLRQASARGASIAYEQVDQPYGYREYSAHDSEGALWSLMKPLAGPCGLGLLAIPLAPPFALRVTDVEHERAARSQGIPTSPERRRPIVFGQEDLGHVGGHGHQVHAKWRQHRRITGDPSDAISARFATSYVERCVGGIDARHLLVPLRKKADEGAGAASDVEHRPGTELVDESKVRIEVAPMGVEGVIDLGQPALLADRINHDGQSAAEPAPVESG